MNSHENMWPFLSSCVSQPPLLTLHKLFPIEHSKTHSWRWRKRKPDLHWWWAASHQSPPQSILQNARNGSEISQHIYLVFEDPSPVPYGWELSGNIRIFTQLLFTGLYSNIDITVDFQQIHVATGSPLNTSDLDLDWEVLGRAFFSTIIAFLVVLLGTVLPCLCWIHREWLGVASYGLNYFPQIIYKINHKKLCI